MTRDEYVERKVAGGCAYSVGCHEPCDGESPWCPRHRRRVRYLRQLRLLCVTKRRRANASNKRWRRRRARLGRCARCSRPTWRKYLCLEHSEAFDRYRLELRRKDHHETTLAPAAAPPAPRL